MLTPRSHYDAFKMSIVIAEIINQPHSGQYKERIYDVQSPWNSQSWSWVRFTDESGNEFVGQFRGSPRSVKVSRLRNEIIVLTSDYVFRSRRKYN